jgi:flagellar M-ring protein FliF
MSAQACAATVGGHVGRLVLSNFSKVVPGLAALGARRLIALAVTGIATVALVLIASFYLSRPSLEAVYVGLEADDVTRIGAALQEASVAYDTNSENSAVYVSVGQAARARMLLAEKGLPKSDRAGYELFDNLGSLGLTSFMQQVTRVRALEGELARSIQLMNGVKAARVHIVMPKEGAFRAQKETPTASIVVRTDGGFEPGAAKAIKHLVAAAVPGLASGDVTVLSTDGSVLAAGDGAQSAAADKMVELEKSVAVEIQDGVAKTLAPFLGLDNFRVNVAVKLNTDRSQTNETVFDPESRVERSVRTTKESGEAQNTASEAPVSVDQNIPQEATAGGAPERASEKKDKREELTNYEINSKTVSTVSDGYKVESLAVAVVINKARLDQVLGASPAAGAADAMLKDIELLVSTAAGTREVRGDKIKITTADFLAAETALEPAAGEGVGEMLLRHVGSLINGTSLVIVVLLALLIGFRPAVRAIIESAPKEQARFVGQGANAQLPAPGDKGVAAIQDFADQILDGPQRARLTQIVELDSDRAARILKAWLNEPERA